MVKAYPRLCLHLSSSVWPGFRQAEACAMCHTYEYGDAGQGLDERRQSQQMFPPAGRVSRCPPLPALESAEQAPQW